MVDKTFMKMKAAAQRDKDDAARREEHYKEQSRLRLLDNVKTKLKTSFIGAISAIEASPFGELCGHGKNIDDLTEDELGWREAWDAVRIRILDNGNNQIRAIISELEHYTVCWNKFHVDFKIRSNHEKQ